MNKYFEMNYNQNKGNYEEKKSGYKKRKISFISEVFDMFGD